MSSQFCMLTHRMRDRKELEEIEGLLVREASVATDTDKGVTKRWLLAYGESHGVHMVLAAVCGLEYAENAPVANRNTVYVSYMDTVPMGSLLGLGDKSARAVAASSLLEGYETALAASGMTRLALWSCALRPGDAYLFLHAQGRIKEEEAKEKFKALEDDWRKRQAALNNCYEMKGTALKEKVRCSTCTSARLTDSRLLARAPWQDTAMGSCRLRRASSFG
jgi:hypothetical protein